MLLSGLAAGCATAPPPAMDLTEERALARFAAEAPETLEGKGRIGVRGPEGESTFSFRLAYDQDMGLRVDLEWKALVGLVRRNGSVLVHGDSVWIDLPEEAAEEWGRGGPSRIDLLGGISAEELVLALLGTSGDLVARREDLVGFRALQRKGSYLFAFERSDLAESLTIDGATGDLRERVLRDRSRERRLRVAYDRYALIDGVRRPAVVDVLDSDGPARIRFVFSEQAVGREQDPARFEPPPRARLLGRGPGGVPDGRGMGTFDPKRGS